MSLTGAHSILHKNSLGSREITRPRKTLTGEGKRVGYHHIDAVPAHSADTYYEPVSQEKRSNEGRD